MVSCLNIPSTIATVLQNPLKLASLHELQTIYGLQDLWDMLEVGQVHIHNQNQVNKAE